MRRGGVPECAGSDIPVGKLFEGKECCKGRWNRGSESSDVDNRYLASFMYSNIIICS